MEKPSKQDAIKWAEILVLAEIDEALGITEDGCNEPDMTISAIKELREACDKLAPWLSAALDDEKVGLEYKRDIINWFDSLPWLDRAFE